MIRFKDAEPAKAKPEAKPEAKTAKPPAAKASSSFEPGRGAAKAATKTKAKRGKSGA